MRGAYQSKNESRPGIRNAIVSRAPSAPEIITASSTALPFWIACAQLTRARSKSFSLPAHQWKKRSNAGRVATMIATAPTAATSITTSGKDTAAHLQA